MQRFYTARAMQALGLETHVVEMAPRLLALIEAYERRSGIPILLNTSFNLAGEPIVTTAAEGYSTFRRSGIDLLAAGNVLVQKRHSNETMLEVAA